MALLFPTSFAGTNLTGRGAVVIFTAVLYAPSVQRASSSYLLNLLIQQEGHPPPRRLAHHLHLALLWQHLHSRRRGRLRQHRPLSQARYLPLPLPIFARWRRRERVLEHPCRCGNAGLTVCLEPSRAVSFFLEAEGFGRLPEEPEHGGAYAGQEEGYDDEEKAAEGDDG